MRLYCSGVSMWLASLISVKKTFGLSSGIHLPWCQQFSQTELVSVITTRNHDGQYAQLLFHEEGEC